MEILSREIPLFKTVFCGEIDRETEKELSLPDYCPDITRLIRVDATPYIEGCFATGNKCTVNGTYVFTVLYESDFNSALSFCSFPISFTESVDVKDAGQESRVSAKMNTRRIGCKMINPRKFTLRVKSGLSLSVKRIERKGIADVTSLPEKVYVKKDTIKWTERSEAKVYEFSFKERYPLAEKSASIDDVVMTSFTAEKPECTVTENGTVLKTAVTAKLLYCSEDDKDKYIMSTNRIPVTVNIDDLYGDGVSVDAEAMVSKTEISVDVDQYGENRIIEASFTLKVTACEERKVTAEYATDGFASEQCGIAVTESFETLAESQRINRVFSAEVRFVPEEIHFTELCDHSARVNECRIKADESGTTLYGTYTVSVLGRGESGYQSFDHISAFEEKISADKISFDDCDIRCDVFEANALLASDGSISVRIMCRAEIIAEKTVTVNAVTDIKAVECEKEKCSVIFCYPAARDDLWSIAKRYFASPEAILSDNPEVFDGVGNIVARTPVRITK